MKKHFLGGTKDVMWEMKWCIPKKKSLGSTAFADIDEEIGALEN